MLLLLAVAAVRTDCQLRVLQFKLNRTIGGGWTPTSELIARSVTGYAVAGTLKHIHVALRFGPSMALDGPSTTHPVTAFETIPHVGVSATDLAR